MSVMQSVQKNSDLSENDFILAVIKSLFIIDLGVVSYVYNRKPDVNDFRNGVYVDVTLTDSSTITNVEFLFPGNPVSCINTAPKPGTRVLVFGTRNSFTSIEEAFPNLAMMYSDASAKCIGLGQIQSGLCSLLMDGGVFFSGPGSKFGMNTAGDIIKKSGNGAVTEVEMPDGEYTKALGGRSFETRAKTDNGYVTEWTVYDKASGNDRKILYRDTFDDATGDYSQYERELTDIKIKREDKKWGREVHRNADGSYTDVIKDEEKKILYSRKYQTDGAIEYSLYEQSEDGEDFIMVLEISPEGSISFVKTTEGNTANWDFTVEPDGSTVLVIGENDEYTLTIKPDGSSSIVCEDKWELEAKGKVSIKTNDTFSAESDKAMSFDTKDAYSAKSVGAMSFDTKDAYSVDAVGDASFTTKGNLSFDAVGSGKMKAADIDLISTAPVGIQGTGTKLNAGCLKPYLMAENAASNALGAAASAFLPGAAALESLGGVGITSFVSAVTAFSMAMVTADNTAAVSLDLTIK